MTLRDILSDIEAEAGAIRDGLDMIDGMKFGDLNRHFDKLSEHCDRLHIAVRAAQQAECDL